MFSIFATPKHDFIPSSFTWDLMPNIFFLRKNLVSQNLDGWQNFVCLVLKQFFQKNLKSPKILLKNLDDPKR